MTPSLFSTRRLRRYVDAIPDSDRVDFVHAIRAMQRELSPEIVRALLEIADAAHAATLPSRPSESHMRALRTAVWELENLSGDR
jgi:hypothetical protein